ncbi:MAG: Sfum_1244 family protein [Thermodesulfovibrionaceae bacterium]
MFTDEFFETVRFNCNVSDAKYWGFFSICGLLLRLRELFKVEKALEPWDSIDNEEIFKWLEEKEKTWQLLKDEEFRPFNLYNEKISPFELERVNSFLENKGMVYGAGYAFFMKPSFFVGVIQEKKYIDGYNVYFVGREIVRDLFSSVGMSIEKTIFIRLINIRYRVWENLPNWFNVKENLSSHLISIFGSPEKWQYPYPEFERIVQKYAQIVFYHEIAEQKIEIKDWDLIKTCKDSKTEHILRGVRDFLVDFSSYGPISAALKNKDKELLIFYILSQGPYQKKILKKTLLDLKNAILLDDWQTIEKIRDSEYEKWKNNNEYIFQIYKNQGVDAVKVVANKIFEGELN